MEISENEMIAKYFAPLSGDGAFQLSDDAAEFLNLKNIVISTDTLCSGVHFFGYESAHLIAMKALRVNLSDLAAKGAQPFGYFLNLSLPRNISEDWLSSFCNGLRHDQSEFKLQLFGGDTTHSQNDLVITITMLGSLKQPMIKRSTAYAGDLVYVTGTIGDAALGLMALNDANIDLTDSEKDFLKERYYIPQPRLNTLPLLHQFATSAMDISDGFVGDLTKLCNVSGVSAEIDLGAIPYSNAARKLISQNKYIECALCGGDDYEILLTISQSSKSCAEQYAQEHKIQMTQVGQIKSGTEAPLFLMNGKPQHFARGSYQHF